MSTQNLIIPEVVTRALQGWADLIKSKLKRGDFIVVDWLDAADEKQVVTVKEEKVPTPVVTAGFYFDVLAGHLCVVAHIFSQKWKDMTYIPVGMIVRIEVREDGLRRSLIKDKTWSGHAHTRKARIARKTRTGHMMKVRRLLGEESWKRHLEDFHTWLNIIRELTEVNVDE